MKLPEELEKKFEQLDPETQKKVLGHQKNLDDLRNGTTEIPEDIRDKMAELNKAPYDANYLDTRCPGRDLNAEYACKACPYQNGKKCQLRVALKKSPKHYAGTNFCIMPGIYMDLPEDCDPQVANLIDPMSRFEILRLYDNYMAESVKVMRSELFAIRTFMNRPQPGFGSELASLRRAEEDADRELSRMFRLAYKFALHNVLREDAPTGEELRYAFEEDQYKQRKALGEPVIYTDGRCWFDGYVASKGYIPGPFPGLEFWRSEKGHVDPKQFAAWLEETKSERERSKLPPVGYTGQLVCRVYAVDVLKFFADVHGACGPKTYLLGAQMPQNYI